MSYCRFQNTLGDLAACEEALADIDSTPLSPHEHKAMLRLLKLCRRIANEYDLDLIADAYKANP